MVYALILDIKSIFKGYLHRILSRYKPTLLSGDVAQLGEQYVRNV